MNSKRLICTIIASTMILSLILTGCGSKTPANTAVVTDPAKLKPVALTMYITGGAAAKDADLVNAAMSKYLKDKINATLNITLFDYASYGTKVGTMIASGEPADLVWTSSGGDLPFVSNVQKNAFLPLDDLMSKYGKDVSKTLGPIFLAAGTVNGKLYGLPVNKDRAHWKGFMFNKAMVTKYNLDITKVKTLEDLEPMLKTVTEGEKTNILTPVGVGTGLGNSPAVLLDFDEMSLDVNVPLALYGNNDASNTKIFNIFESPEYLSQLDTMRRYYTLGYVRKDAATLKNDTSGAEGKGFVTFPQLKPNGDIEASTKKVTYVQQVTTKDIANTNDVMGSMMAITRNSKNPERAMMLMNLMYTDPKLVNMAVFGIEGTNYTKDANNVITPTADPLYSSAPAWRIGNQFLDYLKPGEDAKKWSILDKFNKDSEPLRSIGFVFDGSNFTTELAAIATVSKQYQPVIVTGSVDPKVYVPKYVAALKVAGLDKVQAEVQKQYDAFLAAKKK